jgi:Protein of unknown function (DUF1203)
MSEPDFILRPISFDDADVLRARGGLVCVADEYPGYPCRQCLQDAQIGEELILVSHDPFGTDSVYRSAGPIFLHRASCVSPPDDDSLPIQLTRRQLSVRSFDVEEMMIDAAVIEGSELDAAIKRFFGDRASHTIHVHNATRGCWAVAVQRRHPVG